MFEGIPSRITYKSVLCYSFLFGTKYQSLNMDTNSSKWINITNAATESKKYVSGKLL